jgi:hypothetical protein
MALRNGHGNGVGVPRVEVMPPMSCRWVCRLPSFQAAQTSMSAGSSPQATGSLALEDAASAALQLAWSRYLPSRDVRDDLSRERQDGDVGHGSHRAHDLGHAAALSARRAFC